MLTAIADGHQPRRHSICADLSETWNGGQPEGYTEEAVLPKLIRNLYDIATGKQPPYIEVADDLIIDGHHRYIAGKIAGVMPQQAPGAATHATVMIPWQHVVVEDDDWDFPTPI